ncbi:hypothetical protein WG909_07135 [Peptostreptococcaceae bacterium AGR-M142]
MMFKSKKLQIINKISFIIIFIICILNLNINVYGYFQKEANNKYIYEGKVKSTDCMCIVADYLIDTKTKEFIEDNINLKLKTLLLNDDINIANDTKLLMLINKNEEIESNYDFLDEYMKDSNNMIYIFNYNKQLAKKLNIDIGKNPVKKPAISLDYDGLKEKPNDSYYYELDIDYYKDYEQIGSITDGQTKSPIALRKDNILIFSYFNSDSEILKNIMTANLFPIEEIKEAQKKMQRGEFITYIFIGLIVIFNLALLIIMLVYRGKYKDGLFK